MLLLFYNLHDEDILQSYSERSFRCPRCIDLLEEGSKMEPFSCLEEIVERLKDT